jgi:hypothetical protein
VDAAVTQSTAGSNAYAYTLHSAALFQCTLDQTTLAAAGFAAGIAAGKLREVSHALTLNFVYGSGTVSSSLSGLLVSNFRLSPACVDISDLVLDNEESAEAFARMVSNPGVCVCGGVHVCRSWRPAACTPYSHHAGSCQSASGQWTQALNQYGACPSCVCSCSSCAPIHPPIHFHLSATAAYAIDSNTADTCAQVREVRGRLLSYWRRQVLVEAAAEVFPPTSSARGPPHIRATLNNQVGRGSSRESGHVIAGSWQGDSGGFAHLHKSNVWPQ